MQDSQDIIIVGGGVIGSACAYFLMSSTDFSGTVTVIEPDSTYQNSTTARSVGGIRQQFSTPENIRMSQFALEFLRDSEISLAVDGLTPDLPFVANGYLLLATEPGAAVLESNIAIQKLEGAETRMLSPDDLHRQFPWLNVDDIAAGSFGGANEGWTDPYALMQAFKRKARHLGATYREDSVADLTREGNAVVAITLASGEILSCGTVVNAAGSHAGNIARMAGLTIPVHPRKRFVFVFDCRDAPQNCPLTVDPCGAYFRPEGQTFICGKSPDPEDDPDCTDLEVDHGFFDEHLWPVLAHRVPAFEAIKVVNAWAGLYAYNTLDQNAIVGTHPDVTNLIFANGFSGHGLQQSPAIGRAVSELAIFGEFRALDLSRFGMQRVLDRKPLAEINVI
mgnify:CR=1 FL=1